MLDKSWRSRFLLDSVVKSACISVSWMHSIHSVSTGASKASQGRSSDVSRINRHISDDTKPSVHSCVSRLISPCSSPIGMALGFRKCRFTFWKRSFLCCASSRRNVMSSASTA